MLEYNSTLNGHFVSSVKELFCLVQITLDLSPLSCVYFKEYLSGITNSIPVFTLLLFPVYCSSFDSIFKIGLVDQEQTLSL
jgi:hypothetical protein